jgi:hypothetical protein
MAYTPIKFDTTGPDAPASISVLQNSDGYSMQLYGTYNNLASGKRWAKIYWNTSVKTAVQVHEADENVNNNVCIVEVEGKTFNATFNAKNSVFNNVTLPWNTSGYFSVITYDQTFSDEFATNNPSNLRNYSTVVQSSGFYSSAEYVDSSQLKMSYELDLSTSNKLNLFISFTGYNSISTSITSLNIICKNKRTKIYYNSTGTELGTTETAETFATPKGFGTSIIKYVLPYGPADTYEFTYYTKNVIGALTGPTFNNTYGFEKKIKYEGSWNTTQHPTKYKLNGFRKRAACYVSDIKIQEEKFVPLGNYVSKLYTCKKPIYAIQLQVGEIFDFLKDPPLTPELDTRYYISFSDNNWYRISPSYRRSEKWINEEDRFDLNLNYVPSILLLDSNLSDVEKLNKTLTKNMAYLELGKDMYTCRIKIQLDISSENVQYVSPKITDYAIKVVTRDILLSNILEEDIGNA